MVQLRSCYFCGTADAVSEYETLPERLQAADASRRVVLCDRCQTKLTNVMAPVVDYLDAQSAASPSQSEAEEDADPDPDSDGGEQADVTFVETTPNAGRASSEEGAVDPTPDLDPSTDAETSDSSSTAAEAGDDDDTTAPPAEQSTGDSPSGTSSDPDDSEDAAESTEPGGADELDRVYHKVLRFLRNREFPIPRTEAETVAQSAYDLNAREAAEVIQRAVDRGVLTERDGELHRN